jgi:hypothetical protein
MSLRRARPALVIAALALGASAALAEWLQPDASYRDAQLLLRQAVRDTVGHANDPARLDTLGWALLRLARFDDARTVFGRALAADPQDAGALAAFGKLALFADRAAEAESLLTLATAKSPDAGVLADLYAARLRRGRYSEAALMASQVNDQARVPMLELLAEHPPYRIAGDAPEETRIPWNKGYPVPLMRVKLNGQSLLMALDTGAGDLILDPQYARTAGVRTLPTQSLMFWDGSRVTAQHALVQRLELGGLRIENVPAGLVGLRRWMLQVNPRAEPVAGVIGVGLLRRFTPTIDYRKQALVLRRAGRAYAAPAGAVRVPFEIWGESELMVYGSLNGGRRMAMLLATGLPGCGVAAPADVLAEVGIKPGRISRVIKGAGSVLQGAPWAAVGAANVTVGPLVRDKVDGWSGALDPAELWRHGVRRDAIVSHDFFKGQRVTIDWENCSLVVESSD